VVDADEVVLRPVDASNWRDVADLSPRPDQTQWVAPVTRYLCLCVYDGVWQPLAVEVDGEVVGFVMWGVDESEGSHWIGGLVLDPSHQGRGVGRATVAALLGMFEGLDAYREAALTIAPDNTTARRLYASLGFVETGEESEGELVARRPRGSLAG
jgi:diamine N-acetyltransferase